MQKVEEYESLFQPPLADALARKAEIARARGGRTTLDCFHCKAKGMRAYCEKGHRLGGLGEGQISLRFILRGYRLSNCQECNE